MTMIVIDHPDDPRMVDYLQLTDMDLRRHHEGERSVFMAEGFVVLERALSQGFTPLSVLCSRRFDRRVQELLAREHQDVPVYVADDDVLEAITGFHVHRGALAVLRRPAELSLSELIDLPGDVLILEDLVDPTNVGLAVRSAAAFGWGAMLISPRCADPLYRRAVKSSMGAVLGMPWRRADDLVAEMIQMQHAGVDVIALTPSPQAPELVDVIDGSQRIALLVGTEGNGLQKQSMSTARTLARIDMAPTIDSLNVAASVAVAAFAVQQCRRR